MASKVEPVRASQSYQRFAWVTLALAALVALFASDRSESAAAVADVPPQAAELAVAPVNKSQAALNTLPPAAPADVDSEDGGDTAGEQVEGDSAAVPSLNDEPTPGDAGAKAPVAGPNSAAEAGQLLASSRNRSGGVDQGDEPIRAPAV